jgi:hypothetical protein
VIFQVLDGGQYAVKPHYPVTVNPDRNMKNEKCCSQLSTYFKCKLNLRRQMGHFSVQTKLDNFFEPDLLRSKTCTNSDSFIDE